MSKTLWSEGLQAHRVVIHSHCASPLVPHQSPKLPCAPLQWYTHQAMPKLFSSLTKQQRSDVPGPWRMGIQRERLPFWFLKPLHFLFHSNSPLLAQSFSSSLIITPHLSAFFFLLLSPPTLGLVFMFFSAIAPLSFKQSRTVIYFAAAASLSTPPLRTFFSAYLWSRCSFPSRSPTQRSPGFSLPAGPGIHHMKTPVQVAHTSAYLYQWFINTRVERNWTRNLVHFQ